MFYTLLSIFSVKSIKLSWKGWWQGCPSWVVATVCIAVVGFTVWLYRTDARRLTNTQRRFLLVWRCLALLCVLMILAEPAYKATTEEKRTPVVTVVVDESDSMSLPCSPDNPLITNFRDRSTPRNEKSRYAVAKKVAAKLSAVFSKTHRIKTFLISDGIVELEPPVDKEGNKIKTPTPEEIFKGHEQPTGSYSNIGDNLENIISGSLRNVKASAVFLLSDGRKTGGISLAEAAQTASQNKVPVFTVGIGTKEAVSDLILDDLAAPPEANVNDVMTLQVSVINNLRSSLRTELKLFEDGGKTPRVVKPLLLRRGENSVGISFIPDKEGEHKYTLRVPEYPEELRWDNNVISCHVNVVKRKLKVLFIAGSPTMEFHHLVPSLIRDSVIDVSCYLQTADVNAVQQGNDVIKELPRTTKDWNRYDVVILYDIDPNQFTNEQENGLEWLINSGGGLLFVAGRVNGMGKLLQVRGAKLQGMMPVEINKSLRPDFARLYAEPFHIVRTKAGRKHPLLMFSMDAKQNDKVWKSFADIDFYWCHPVEGLKRGAVPLLEKARAGLGGGRRVPVMALKRYGKGSAIYLGIHTMWRWRYPMENYDYDQFWSQTVRYLGEVRMLGSQRQVVLSTDKKLYAPGEDVHIKLSLLDPALVSQLRSEAMFVEIKDSKGGLYKKMLRPSPRDPTVYTATYQARRQGEHLVRARHVLKADLATKQALFDEKKHFNVRMQSLEYKNTTADLDGMKALAELTGGETIPREELGKLNALKDKVSKEPQLVTHDTFDDLWDSGWILAALLFFGTVELYFRRRWSLL